MRKLTTILAIGLMSATVLSAQDFDRQVLATEHITGTARYVGMSGAMTAVGGDVSAAVDNPAGLGVFRRSELSITIDGGVNTAITSAARNSNNRSYVPQISWVINFQEKGKTAGWIANNILLQFHRIGNYKRGSIYQGRYSTSLTDIMADATNGLSRLEMDDANAWDNADIGWLSLHGYKDSLIYPVGAGSTAWLSILNNGEQVNSKLEVAEYGGVNQYSFAYGANISNRYYWGLSLNLLTNNYSKVTNYSETFDLGGSMKIRSSFTSKGIGFSAALGFIARPVKGLRIGASIHSPSISKLTTSNTSYSSSVLSGALFVADPKMTINTDVTKYTLPLKTTFGVAYTFSTKAMISFEYDYRYQLKRAIADQHRFKIGFEAVPLNNLFVRGGYSYSSTFKSDLVFIPDITDTRTDCEAYNIRNIHYASVGIGYRSRRWVIEGAYQFSVEQGNMYMHGMQAEPLQLTSMDNHIVITFAWRY